MMKSHKNQGKSQGRGDRKKYDGKLQPTSFTVLGLIFAVSLIAAFFFVDSWITAGNIPFMAPRWGFLVPIVLAVFVLWEGWQVRAYRGRKRALSPLAAGRIWLLSQAASRTGAIISGVAFGVVGSYASHTATGFLSAQMLNFALAAFGSLVLVCAGWIAERWCMVDDDDDPEGGAVQSAFGGAQPV